MGFLPTKYRLTRASKQRFRFVTTSYSQALFDELFFSLQNFNQGTIHKLNQTIPTTDAICGCSMAQGYSLDRF
jgi:hypothetical protein